MKGFGYNIDLCVGCLACVAGCRLENHYSIPWRSVITSNPDLYPGLPVHNLSLSCNHCENPVCSQGCPTGAITIDGPESIVTLDSSKCMGCNYCYWNCPYDAPVYNSELREMEKCTLCKDRLDENLEPACASACPTGALTFTEINELSQDHLLFDIRTKPRLTISGKTAASVTPEVIPASRCSRPAESDKRNKPKIIWWREWPLILFTFVSSLLVSFVVASLQSKEILPLLLTLSIYIIMIILPFFHIGKIVKALRALSNIRSPLSRELILILVFGVSLFTMYRFASFPSIIFSSLTGLLFLAAIDNVYSFTDKRAVIHFHPCGALISGLSMASVIADRPEAFIFITAIRIIFALRIRNLFRPVNISDWYWYIYIASSAFIIYYLYSYGVTWVVYTVVIPIELVNRIVFYIDFTPVSLKKQFIQNTLTNEKER